MPLTLLDELQLERNELRSGVIQSIVEQVTIQDRLPWETTDSMQLTVVRLTDIPRIPMRMINEVPSGVQAHHTQSQETLYIMDTDIDIDPVLMMAKNRVMSLEVAQTKAVSAAIGFQINDQFINADTGTEPRNPMGLKARLRDDVRFVGGTVNATANATKLDFSPDASDANKNAALTALDELLLLVMRGKASALISNQQFILRMWAAMRTLKLLDTTRDQFDREIISYHKVPILDIGYTPEAAINGTPDATTVESNQIIGYDADDYDSGNDPGPGNGANAYTDTNTIYAVRWSPSTGRPDGSATDGLIALQQAPLKIEPLGKTQEPPHFYRTNVLWVYNPSVPLDHRCIGRLIGFQLT